MACESASRMRIPAASSVGPEEFFSGTAASPESIVESELEFEFISFFVASAEMTGILCLRRAFRSYRLQWQLLLVLDFFGRIGSLVHSNGPVHRQMSPASLKACASQLQLRFPLPESGKTTAATRWRKR